MNKDNEHIKTVVFDLDGTLTESRSVITHKMTDKLRALEGLYNVVVISGAQRSQMLHQIPWMEDSLITVMGQSGNDSRKEDVWLINNYMTFQDVYSVLLHLEDIYKHFGMGDEVGGDRIEIRGGQISWSMIGHNKDKKIKAMTDPHGKYRKNALEKNPFKNDEMMVRIGGTTCLDYTRVGWGKKGNLEKLFKLNDWKFEDAVYIGDQLYEGGNDEDVMELMDVVSVEHPNDTLKFIDTLL